MDYDHIGFVAAEDGTRIFVGVRGVGSRTILLVDGIGCDGWIWNYLHPHLAHTHRVIHSHYRGHGRSGAPQGSARTDIVTLAKDLGAVLDHHAVNEVVVIGHSMGCQTALELYRARPQQVEALVLLCGSYGKVTATFHGSDLLAQTLPKIIALVQNNRGLVRALWGRLPGGLAYRIAKYANEINGLHVREEDFKQYVQHVASLDPDLFLAMLQEAGEHTAEDVLPEIRVPTLVIAGEGDTFTPVALARHMAEVIPNAEYLELKGGTHAAPIEFPDVVRTHIDRFLAESAATDTVQQPASV